MRLNHLFLTLALASIGMPVAAQTDYFPGYGARLDYFNSTGIRVSSMILDNPGVVPFSIYKSYEDPEWYVIDAPNAWERVFSMKIVPWGTQSYPVTVETEADSGIEVSYQVISAAGSDECIAMKAGSAGNVLCGMTIRFDINVPDGTYPVLKYSNAYTMIDSQGVPWWNDISAFGLSALRYNNFVWMSGYQILAPEYREMFREQMEGYNGFVRDPANPNHWTYDWVMGNEPVNFSFETMLPGEILLRGTALAMLGQMYAQYQQGNYNSTNTGEPMMMSVYGEYPGDAEIAGLESTYREGSTLGIMNFYDKAKYFPVALPWSTVMSWINNANLLLRNLDKYVYADHDSRRIAKAQMLVMRSHAYWRLLQLYGKRWSESDNGRTPCAPLETVFTTDPQPIASMREIADQCYADLNEAIDILASANFQRECIWEPDADVARGVKLRIALLREDWANVRSLANEILDHKPLTTNDDLLSGFYTPADSWIWGSWNNQDLIRYDVYNSLYFWAFQHKNACNGAYAVRWNMGANAMDRDLYKHMDAGDVRRTLYVMPENGILTGTFTKESKWYSIMVNRDYAGMCLSSVDAETVITHYHNKAPYGCYSAFTYNNEPGPVQFGAQTKFYLYGWETGGDNAVCYMRAEEVLLSLAEACWHLGDMSAARENLSRLELMRNPGFVAPAAGEELLDAIKLARKVELWGEGHNWYDMKRWRETRVRRAWIKSDVTSGNWRPELSGTVLPDDKNGWRLMVPWLVVKYNPLIDVNSYGYEDVSDYEDARAQSPRAIVEKGGKNIKPALDRGMKAVPTTPALLLK